MRNISAATAAADISGGLERRGARSARRPSLAVSQFIQKTPELAREHKFSPPDPLHSLPRVSAGQLSPATERNQYSVSAPRHLPLLAPISPAALERRRGSEQPGAKGKHPSLSKHTGPD